ncbi:type II toxin-antitoxin system VapC family toxin [Nocardia cyriacigeorgica]|uniref:Ribonuclease VapC n=1 Tax=Nocardia cyriacigeorgica TaxID=135487 RepID=A0A6P1D7C7_9NOCA|nr:type II toxin-antitoxin system VapC family toxin [Nocardia cyriacigeorgica]NEW41412.1 type II toxin-antitoxin system VapC family toxin [Nocardia cyriacigeorgica]NEW44743.1 type II toxin-antitoxin system VapC family toxin [Nocardia cyriacigeorgica]NEW50855.1 type II toxin-antitoxin system VapC family toxin [Nocardia cyriacigeorgica]NEW57841.1 type II toxin-antitoxin system VapC family toxin [Nocardia cyriacigeorgica]
MKIVDLNVLLYAINEDSPHHRSAHAWLEEALNGVEPIGFCWAVILGYIRISTNPRIFPNPPAAEDVVSDVRSWLSSDAAVVVEPGPRHLDLMEGLLEKAGTAGNLVTDTHIAALAIEHGAGVVTFDSDFERFDGVRWSKPSA